MNKVKIEITYEYADDKQKKKVEEIIDNLRTEARISARVWNLEDSIKISYVKDHMAV